MTAIFNFMTQFLSSKIGSPLFLLIGASAALGWGLWYAENENHKQTVATYSRQIETLRGNLKTLENVLEDRKKSYEKLQEMRQADRESSIRLDLQYALAVVERDKANERLQSYQSRWRKAATAKPKLVSRLINRATDKRVRSFSTATCRAHCDDDGDSSGGAIIAKEARSDFRR